VSRVDAFEIDRWKGLGTSLTLLPSALGFSMAVFNPANITADVGCVLWPLYSARSSSS
jgi:hypothetical protein